LQQRWQHFKKKIPVGHVEADYELMNYSILAEPTGG